MKIYLWSLLLSLSLGAIEIPLHGSVTTYGVDYFYIDIKSLKYGETINLQVSYYKYFDYCKLEYRRSNSYDDDEYLEEFDILSYQSYTLDSDNSVYYYSFPKDSYYNYILLKMSLYYPTSVTIYYNKPNYTWVIWLVIIIIIIIGIIILIICLKRKKDAKALADSSHQPTVNDNQPPVNAYQPPVYEPQPPQYVQPS